MSKKYFPRELTMPIYEGWYKSLEGFGSDEKAAHYLLSLTRYFFDEQMPDDPLELMMIRQVRYTLDSTRAGHFTGKMGGRPRGETPLSPEGETPLCKKGETNRIELNRSEEKVHSDVSCETSTACAVSSRRFTPPSPEEVRAYCTERENTVDAQKFCDHYAAKGWKIGTSPMKDWKAAVRTWEGREDKPAAADDTVLPFGREA